MNACRPLRAGRPPPQGPQCAGQGPDPGPGGRAGLLRLRRRPAPGRQTGAPRGPGQLVFCTAMTGYQEVCSDPSYRRPDRGAHLPLINNYGVNPADQESTRPWLHALIVREYCPRPQQLARHRAPRHWLDSQGIPICQGIDTRALTRHLRTHGAKRAVLAPPHPDDLPAEDGDQGPGSWGAPRARTPPRGPLVERARAVPPSPSRPWWPRSPGLPTSGSTRASGPPSPSPAGPPAPPGGADRLRGEAQHRPLLSPAGPGDGARPLRHLRRGDHGPGPARGGDRERARRPGRRPPP